jgi:PAS domain S-box-containing protein
LTFISVLATGRLRELGQRARDSSAHRLFAKLVLVLVPAFVLPASIGLWWLAALDIEAEHNRLTSRIGNATARVAHAVARQLERDVDSVATRTTVQELLGTLLSDQAVVCVELIRGSEADPLALAPARIGCLGQVIDIDIEVALPGRTSDRLIVYLSTDEIRAARRSRRELSFVMLLGGLAIALLASWVGFQSIVGRPLGTLLRAIRGSELGGAARLARNSSNDELGDISRSFNAMQLRMQRDADRLEQALGDLDRVHNTTPGLLCATDERGTITSVSDHWLASTGFDRAAVLGRPLTDYLASRHLQTFEKQIRRQLADNGRVADLPLQLRRNKGADFDILLSAVVYRDPTCDKISHLYAMTDIGELRTVERRLEHLARTDPLCELPNRRGFIEHLRVSKDRAQHRPMSAAVLFIDLDNFRAPRKIAAEIPWG